MALGDDVLGRRVKSGSAAERGARPRMSSLVRDRQAKLVRFLAAGLPAFLIALPLNVYLVTGLGWHQWVAYAIVLAVQVTINFFACTLFVFDRNKGRSLLAQFLEFFGIVASMRLLDWVAYVGWTGLLGMHFVAAQLVNVGLFALVKFLLAQRAIER